MIDGQLVDVGAHGISYHDCEARSVLRENNWNISENIPVQKSCLGAIHSKGIKNCLVATASYEATQISLRKCDISDLQTHSMVDCACCQLWTARDHPLQRTQSMYAQP